MTEANVDSTTLDHHPSCEDTTPDGAGCNCGAYARALRARAEVDTARAAAALVRSRAMAETTAGEREVEALAVDEECSEGNPSYADPIEEAVARGELAARSFGRMAGEPEVRP